MGLAGAKERRRAELPPKDISAADFGKLAERVRRLDGYGKCRQLFVSPVAALSQVRINALIDQKELIMPTGGLKQGFVRFQPNTIPFNQLGHAVSFTGMEKFGKKISTKALKNLEIDLLLMDSEAVDQWGGRLGDGLGLTDLAIAILQECTALGSGAKCFCIASENRIISERLPTEAWDVIVDGVITLSGITHCSQAPFSPPVIQWPALARKKIRKIQPLWDLSANHA